MHIVHICIKYTYIYILYIYIYIYEQCALYMHTYIIICNNNYIIFYNYYNLLLIPIFNTPISRDDYVIIRLVLYKLSVIMKSHNRLRNSIYYYDILL